MMKSAGLSLKDFRGKTKSERAFIWLIIVANYEFSKYDIGGKISLKTY